MAQTDSDSESLKSDSESLKSDSESLKSDSESLKSDSESLKSDSESLKSDSESLKENESQNEFEDRSDRNASYVIEELKSPSWRLKNNCFMNNCFTIIIVGHWIGIISGVVVLAGILFFNPMAIAGSLIGAGSAVLCLAAEVAKWDDKRIITSTIKMVMIASLIVLRAGSMFACHQTSRSELVGVVVFRIAILGITFDGFSFALNFMSLNTESKFENRVNNYTELFHKKKETDDNDCKNWHEKNILWCVIILVQINLMNKIEVRKNIRKKAKTDLINVIETLEKHEKEIWKTFVDLNIQKLQEKRVTGRQCSAEQNNTIRINALLDIVDHVIQMNGVESISEVATKTSEHVALLSEDSQSQWLEFLFIYSPPGNNNGNQEGISNL